ncbi:DUF5320 domain-containing protein [Streptomyces sp. SID14515]|uniref:DUF5320 domain-containing protein n=1 Tax=Streptomyces sp. SID14515 TaxID=2706074 RepID=UPI0013CC5A8A|nr:DUF5320 domain-containing protein [Streptomyces sp. SID14515]NEB37939.1 DUF5320 domain-containing protein [Streptomyces sp. SID14515]
MSTTGIQQGMTGEEVTDLIGPPLDSLRMDLMFGGASVSGFVSGGPGGDGLADGGPAGGSRTGVGPADVGRTGGGESAGRPARTGRGRGLFGRLFGRREAASAPHPVVVRSGPPASFSSSFNWFYPGFPEGQDTIVTVTRGIVTEIVSRPCGGAPPPTERANPWAADLMARHIARVERDLPDLASHANWSVLTSDEVHEQVLRVHTSGPEGGQVACKVRRFGDLDVLVSSFDTIDPAVIRDHLPGGYIAQLDRLLKEYGIRVGSTDIAHWILCRDPGTGTPGVHLAYVTRVKGVPVVMPWDLLTPEEQKGGRLRST